MDARTAGSDARVCWSRGPRSRSGDSLQSRREGTGSSPGGALHRTSESRSNAGTISLVQEPRSKCSEYIRSRSTVDSKRSPACSPSIEQYAGPEGADHGSRRAPSPFRPAQHAPAHSRRSPSMAGIYPVIVRSLEHPFSSFPFQSTSCTSPVFTFHPTCPSSRQVSHRFARGPLFCPHSRTPLPGRARSLPIGQRVGLLAAQRKAMPSRWASRARRCLSSAERSEELLRATS